jgi:HSP20 family protein
MKTLIPWRRRSESMFEGFRQEMNDLVKRFFPAAVSETDGGMLEAWAPQCDVEETDKEIIVKADLPGVDAKDVDISVMDNALIMRGEKKEEKEEKKKNYHRVERFSGQFYREITLPQGVDAERITATSANGTITVTIPKKPGAQPKKIAVKTDAK